MALVNFHRIFTRRDPSEVSAGLIRLKPGVDAEQMAKALQNYLIENNWRLSPPSPSFGKFLYFYFVSFFATNAAVQV